MLAQHLPRTASRPGTTPAIQKLNPGISLPNENHRGPVYRSDGSGTSYNFTDYLSSVSATWKSKIGVSTQPAFPDRVKAAKGSSGVAGVVSKTEGAIGYADIAFAITNKIPVMAVKNAAGKFLTPGLKSIAAAASTIKSVPATNEMHIVNPPASQPKAYPICTFTYVIVPLQTSKAPLLKKFIFYALTQGQAVRSQAAIRADSEGRPRRRREDAHEDPQLDREHAAHLQSSLRAVPCFHGAARSFEDVLHDREPETRAA